MLIKILKYVFTKFPWLRDACGDASSELYDEHLTRYVVHMERTSKHLADDAEFMAAGKTSIIHDEGEEPEENELNQF
jgi:hypothetical protein